MRKGNGLLMCICSHPLHCSHYPIFLFLGLSDCTGHAGLGTGKASALRLVCVTAAFFLYRRERGKSPGAELLPRGARGSRWRFCKEHSLLGSISPASGLRTQGHPRKRQGPHGPRAGPRSGPELTAPRWQRWLHSHPAGIGSSANDSVRNFVCQKHLKNKLGLFTCKSVNNF